MSGNTRKTCLMPHLVMCAHVPVYLETRAQNGLKKSWSTLAPSAFTEDNDEGIWRQGWESVTLGKQK